MFYKQILLFGCDKYTTDDQIIDTFPFLVHNNPFFRYPTETYALKNPNGSIDYMNIANQECIPSIIYCLRHLSMLDVRNTSFCGYEQQLPIEIIYFPSSLIHLGIWMILRSLIYQKQSW